MEEIAFRRFSVALIILMIVDVISTYFLVNNGIGKEGNPLLKDVSDNIVMLAGIKLLGTVIILAVLGWAINKNRFVAIQGMKLITIIMLVVVINNIGVGIASAETGSITVTSSSNLVYTPIDNAPASAVNWGRLVFDTADYNKISNFRWFDGASLMTFAHDYESTSFTCNAPNICSGVFWYDKSTKSVYYAFIGNPVISVSAITLTFSNVNVPGNVTGNWGHGLVLSSTQPVYILNGVAVDGGANAGTYQNVVAISEATDSYNVTYPFSNGFTINVTKGNVVNTKWKILDGANNQYTTESSFNKINFQYTNSNYNGIIFNVSKADGSYTLKTINLTGTSYFTAPAPTPIINPITGVGIIFDSPTYALGGIANISWIRTTATPLLCTDIIYHTYPDQTKTAIVISPPDSGYFKENLNSLGMHTASFERECLFQAAQVLDSDTATVSTESPSYILATSPQGAGIAFNVTYLFGYTPKNQGELNSIVIEKLTNDVWIQSNAVSLNNTAIVAGTEYNKSITVGDIGKYRIRLFELNRGYVAQVVIDSIAVNIPTLKNISTSIIEVDKQEYLKSDEISIYYAIDNTNYSNYYSKYISVIHASGSYPETSHILLTEQEDTINYASSSGLLQRAKPGLNYVQLRAKNNTADILLTNTSFNISFIDAEGYGLDVVDPEVCKGEKITIKYSTPTLSTLRINIASDTSVPTKYYEIPINGTHSIDLKLSQAADYQILIYEGTVGNIKKFTTAKATNCQGAVAPSAIGGAAMQAQTDNFLSSGMFIVMVILILFAGAGLHFGGMGGAIIGFGAGFIFSAIYGLIPLWALFLFAILVITAFAVMIGDKFTFGGGGDN